VPEAKWQKTPKKKRKEKKLIFASVSDLDESI
jgi:hypothetical protein